MSVTDYWGCGGSAILRRYGPDVRPLTARTTFGDACAWRVSKPEGKVLIRHVLVAGCANNDGEQTIQLNKLSSFEVDHREAAQHRRSAAKPDSKTMARRRQT
jgi:hypothetical protein